MCGSMTIEKDDRDMCGICSSYWENVVRRRVKDEAGKKLRFSRYVKLTKKN